MRRGGHVAPSEARRLPYAPGGSRVGTPAKSTRGAEPILRLKDP